MLSGSLPPAARAQLAWVARLPLVSDAELARVMGAPGYDPRSLNHELERRGWLWSLHPDARAPLRRAVRPNALPALAELVGCAPEQLAEGLACGERALLGIAPRLGLMADCYGLLGAIATASRGAAVLSDARALPAGRRAATPRGAQGYGCLHSRPGWAPFFIYCDHAVAPRSRRVALARAWHEQADTLMQRWHGLPPLLVVCAGQRERQQWADALASVRGRDRAAVFVATVPELAGGGPGAAVWRRDGDRDPAPLLEQLGWAEAPPLQPLTLRAPAAPRPPAGPSLDAWAEHAACPPSAPPWRRLGLLALRVDRADLELIACLARHQLLLPEQLAAVLNQPLRGIAARCRRLRRLGALLAEPGGALRPSELALGLLAAGAGVPLRSYLRYGQLGTTSFPAHLAGVNAFVVRLIQDLRGAGWVLSAWRNAAEAARPAGVRPDAEVTVQSGRRRATALLEYERGTSRPHHLEVKLRGYDAYYARAGARPPTLLVVSPDHPSEQRLLRVAAASAPHASLLSTTEERLDADPEGLRGAVWRAIASPPRHCWPPHGDAPA